MANPRVRCPFFPDVCRERIGRSGWVEYFVRWHLVADVGLWSGVVFYVGCCGTEGLMWRKGVEEGTDETRVREGWRVAVLK